MALIRNFIKPELLTRKNLYRLTAPAANMMTFWERDKKAGYGNPDRPSMWDLAKEGSGHLGPELKKFFQEYKDRCTFQNIEYVTHGSYKLIAQLNTQQALDEWVLTVDADHMEGNSKAEFYLNEKNYAVFSGFLDTTIPKDGVVKKSGYCSIRSPYACKSLKRRTTYDFFADYTHLVVRYRGDGRPYLVNLKLQHDLDFGWQDVYSYVLFTKGGPYWQVAKIPFSKFYHGFKGRVQDKQWRLPLDKVEHFGFTCADQNTGPFYLELDYMGLICDTSHSEQFAYEMYEVPWGVANC